MLYDVYTSVNTHVAFWPIYVPTCIRRYRDFQSEEIVVFFLIILYYFIV